MVVQLQRHLNTHSLHYNRMNMLHDNPSNIYVDSNFPSNKFIMNKNLIDVNTNTNNINSDIPNYKLFEHFPNYTIMNNHPVASNIPPSNDVILTKNSINNIINTINSHGTSAFRTPSPIMDFMKEQSSITQSSPKQTYPNDICHLNTINDRINGNLDGTKMNIADLKSTIQLASKLAQHFIALSNKNNSINNCTYSTVPLKSNLSNSQVQQQQYDCHQYSVQHSHNRQEFVPNLTNPNHDMKLSDFYESSCIQSLDQLTELLYQQYYQNSNNNGLSIAIHNNTNKVNHGCKASVQFENPNQLDNSHFDETIQFTPLQSSLEESGCIDLSYNGSNKTPIAQNKQSTVNLSTNRTADDTYSNVNVNNSIDNTDQHIKKPSELSKTIIQKSISELQSYPNISSFLTSKMMMPEQVSTASSTFSTVMPTNPIQTVNGFNSVSPFENSLALPLNTDNDLNDYRKTNDFFSTLLKLKIPTVDKMNSIFVKTATINNNNIDNNNNNSNTNINKLSDNPSNINYKIEEYSPEFIIDECTNHPYRTNRANNSSCSNSSIISNTGRRTALDKHYHHHHHQQPKTNGAARTKNRKSGFQPGVTVGYTYDAFFISDGRSRKRVKNSHIKQSKSQKRRSYPSDDSMHIISPQSNATNVSRSCSLDDLSNCTNEEQTNNSVLNNLPKSHVSSIASTSLLTTLNESQTQRYSCPDCGKNYATSSNLSRHKQTHRSLDSQSAKKCPQCGKAYVSMPALSMHLLTHDLKHQCDICGKAFSRPWLLQGHRRAHTGEKPYGCAHCGRAFADRSNLRAHMQTHSGMKQFECKKCHKNFALKSYLNKHLESGCMNKSDWPIMNSSITTEEQSYLSPELLDKAPELEFHQQSDLSWSVSKLIN